MSTTVKLIDDLINVIGGVKEKVTLLSELLQPISLPSANNLISSPVIEDKEIEQTTVNVGLVFVLKTACELSVKIEDINCRLSSLGDWGGRPAGGAQFCR